MKNLSTSHLYKREVLTLIVYVSPYHLGRTPHLPFKERYNDLKRAFGDDSSAFCGAFAKLRQPSVTAVRYTIYLLNI